jgi:hypothetical protein
MRPTDSLPALQICGLTSEMRESLASLQLSSPRGVNLRRNCRNSNSHLMLSQKMQNKYDRSISDIR